MLCTPEKPDDVDNPLQVAFGNEASDRDIDEFARRFGVDVWDGFGSTENAVIITREPGRLKAAIGKGFDGVAKNNSDTVQECAVSRFDQDGTLVNPDDAIGELVNTAGTGFFTGYYNNDAANAERMRHGMYWSGDLAYRDPDGWIYFAGRTADWMRIDGEDVAAAPIERIILRLAVINRVAFYAVPDDNVGDQVIAAIVVEAGETLTPAGFV